MLIVFSFPAPRQIKFQVAALEPTPRAWIIYSKPGFGPANAIIIETLGILRD
jgi:hypothetical protein